MNFETPAPRRRERRRPVPNLRAIEATNEGKRRTKARDASRVCTIIVVPP